MSSSPRAPTTAEETGLESGSEQSSELISISRIARSAELPCVDLTAFDGSVFNLARHFKPSQIVPRARCRRYRRASVRPLSPWSSPARKIKTECETPFEARVSSARNSCLRPASLLP